jgi:hypothetical protein
VQDKEVLAVLVVWRTPRPSSYDVSVNDREGGGSLYRAMTSSAGQMHLERSFGILAMSRPPP